MRWSIIATLAVASVLASVARADQVITFESFGLGPNSFVIIHDGVVTSNLVSTWFSPFPLICGLYGIKASMGRVPLYPGCRDERYPGEGRSGVQHPLQ